MKKILIIKLSALGDFIQSLGAMKAIREHHKDAHITLLTTAPFKKFAEQTPYFNGIWLDNRPSKFNITGWFQLRKKLNSGNFDRVYDLQNNTRTSIYLKLFSKKPEWNGAAKGASHRNTCRTRKAGHAFDGHIQTLSIAGIHNVEIDTMDWIHDDISALRPKGDYALIVPGCSPGREEKRWSAENFSKICDHLHIHNITPVIIGTPPEHKLSQDIDNHSVHPVLNLVGKTTLNELIVMGRHAKISIGNDTGPMHMIAATGTPCLTLFSQHSDPIKHAPKGKESHTLREDNLDNLPHQRVIKAADEILKFSTSRTPFIDE